MITGLRRRRRDGMRIAENKLDEEERSGNCHETLRLCMLMMAMRH
jgi:hypothetical protein